MNKVKVFVMDRQRDGRLSFDFSALLGNTGGRTARRQAEVYRLICYQLI